MQRRITVDELMSWEPGEDYPRELVEELWAGREALTPREITDLSIWHEDIIWALCKMLPIEQVNGFTRWAALRVIHLWQAPGVMVRYLDTGDEHLRLDARRLAKERRKLAWKSVVTASAATIGTAYAIYEATDAAVAATYADVVGAVGTAGAAVAAVAQAAANTACGDDEQQAQIDYLIEMLEDNQEEL